MQLQRMGTHQEEFKHTGVPFNSGWTRAEYGHQVPKAQQVCHWRRVLSVVLGKHGAEGEHGFGNCEKLA